MGQADPLPRTTDQPEARMRQDRDIAIRQHWRLPAEICAAVRQHNGRITYAELSERVEADDRSITGALTRLREADLLDTVQEVPGKRGRHDAQIVTHPRGPVIAALEIMRTRWRLGIAGLDGVIIERLEENHDDPNPVRVVEALARTLVWCHETYGYRLRVTSVAVAATVRGTVVAQSSALPWDQVDLAPIQPPHSIFMAHNDGTLAALAEARRGAARGHHTSLHLLLGAGVSGGLVVGERPFNGSTGAAMEVGHLPFGNPRAHCDCGATGCWNTVISGPMLARRLGVKTPTLDTVTQAIHSTDPVNRQVVQSSAWSFGRGVGGLINTTDPDVITVAGLAPALLEAAPGYFDEGLRSATMRHRQTSLPPILTSQIGLDGPFLGAIDAGLDKLTRTRELARWAESR